MNECNERARCDLLKAAWAEDGTYSQGGRLVRGCEALSEFIGHTLAHSSSRFVITKLDLSNPPEFAWQMSNRDEPRESNAHVAFDACGRLSSVTLKESGQFISHKGRSSARSRVAAAVSTSPFQALSIGIVVLYLLLRIPVDVYYDHFHAIPEQAGYNTIDLLLIQAAPALALSLVTVFLFCASGAVTYPAYMTAFTAWILGKRRAVGYLHVSITVLCLSLIYAPLYAIVHQYYWYGYSYSTGAIAALAVWSLVALLILFVFLSHTHKLQRRLFPDDIQACLAAHRSARKTARMIVIAYGLGTIVLIVQFGNVLARLEAHRAMSRETVSTPLMPWRAHSVKVDWKVSQPHPLLPGCSMYLGEADGRVLLFDKFKRKTLRIPSADVILTFPGC